MYYMTALLHPSYVYSSQFYPDTSYEKDERLVIATICYDQKVRLWLIKMDLHGQYQQHDCILELSIMEKPNIKVGGAMGIYE